MIRSAPRKGAFKSFGWATLGSIRRFTGRSPLILTPSSCSNHDINANRRHLTGDHSKPLVVNQGTHDYRWVRKSNGTGTLTRIQPADSWAFYKKRAMLFILPQGYPRTVAPGFLTFFKWTIVGQASGAFCVTVATQALLQSFFTGSSPALWLLKDLLPTFLTALLANVVFSYERRAKDWFVVAAALGQFGVLCELLIPMLVPQHAIVFAACFTSFMKGSAILMLGVTRTTMLQHYALAGNIGELSKKVTTVIMVMYPLMGALGIAFASAFPSWYVQVATVCACSFITVGSSVKAVRNTNFTILTHDNVFVIIERFLQSNVVPTPQELGHEIGLFSMARSPYAKDVQINPSLQWLELETAKFDGFTGYVVGVCPVTLKTSFFKRIFTRNAKAVSTPKLVVLMARNCKFRDVICAMMRSVTYLRRCQGPQGTNWEEAAKLSNGLTDAEEKAHAERVDQLMEQLRIRGWNTMIHHIDSVPSRVKFLSEEDGSIVSMAEDGQTPPSEVPHPPPS